MYTLLVMIPNIEIVGEFSRELIFCRPKNLHSASNNYSKGKCKNTKLSTRKHDKKERPRF
jgi:hypothetical protein